MEPLRSDLCLIAGSGLADTFDLRPDTVHPYHDFPELHAPGVEGHRAEVRMYTLHGTRVMMFCGRSHLYEGLSVEDTTAPLRLAARFGARSAVITNAVGGLHPLFCVGDIMIASDIMDLTFRQRVGTSRMPGPDVIDQVWANAVADLALSHHVPVRRGVYLQVLGPSYETRAEIRMARRLGADAIGMSTAHEARGARDLGMKVVVCSVITNVLTDTHRTPLSHTDVLEAQRSASGRVQTVLQACIHAAS